MLTGDEFRSLIQDGTISATDFGDVYKRQSLWTMNADVIGVQKMRLPLSVKEILELNA